MFDVNIKNNFMIAFLPIALIFIIWGIIDVCRQPTSVFIKILLSLLIIFTSLIGFLIYFAFIRRHLKNV